MNIHIYQGLSVLVWNHVIKRSDTRENYFVSSEESPQAQIEVKRFSISQDALSKLVASSSSSDVTNYQPITAKSP